MAKMTKIAEMTKMAKMVKVAKIDKKAKMTSKNNYGNKMTSEITLSSIFFKKTFQTFTST